jgi:hypothetical protein
VIDEEGNQLGIMNPMDALNLAKSKDLDLVEGMVISQNEMMMASGHHRMMRSGSSAQDINMLRCL